jgi:hypothetical protein
MYMHLMYGSAIETPVTDALRAKSLTYFLNSHLESYLIKNHFYILPPFNTLYLVRTLKSYPYDCDVCRPN